MVALLGVATILSGVAMIVLPGPGLLAILFGLVLLAMEFLCVRRWMRQGRRIFRRRQT